MGGARVRSDKKAVVMGKSPGRRRGFPVLPVSLAALLLAGLVAVAGLAARGGGAGRDPAGGSYRVEARRYDPARRIEQTEVVPQFRDGKIYLDLATLRERGIVRFTVPDRPVTLPNGSRFDSLPVTAYIAPSGRVVAAVSFCEPCSGTRFHIRGDRLACNVCGTQWRLEDLKGITGGCLLYPPDEVGYRVEGDTLILDEQELRSWEPRI